MYEDRCGPIIVDWLNQRSIATGDPVVVADGSPVGPALRAALAENVDVILTSGGTGISPTDATPQATAAVLDYQIPAWPKPSDARACRRCRRRCCRGACAGWRGAR